MSGSTKRSQYLGQVEASFDRAISSGIVHLSTQDQAFDGRHILVNGKNYVNFSSCSYLGLELDPRLKAAARDAIDRYGTQFSSSRAYVSLGLYDELESLLGEVFEKPVVVAPTTTLGHLSMLPVLIGDNDVLILDYQVHASVTTAAEQLRGRGVRVEMIRHSNMEMLEQRIKKLATKYDRIWYLADGIYSMFGDGVPMEQLRNLHDRYEQLHLYIDDAHGVSWTGERGRGFVAETLGGDWPERMYLTGSMAKSFGCVGGILVFPNEQAAQAVRKMGNTLIFSGPIQPATLAAAIASVRIHLSSELPTLQKRLRKRIDAFEHMAEALGLPTASEIASPIRFIKTGNGELAFRMVKRLMEEGFYCNPASFPSVPHKDSGLRMTIHNHLKVEDIQRLLITIKELWMQMAPDMGLHIPNELASKPNRIAV